MPTPPQGFHATPPGIPRAPTSLVPSLQIQFPKEDCSDHSQCTLATRSYNKTVATPRHGSSELYSRLPAHQRQD